MIIKLNESLENKLNDNKKVILTETSNLPSSLQTLLWSFIYVSGPTDNNVFHSSNSKEGTFLNYGNTAPKIEISLPIEGEYNIKISSACSYNTVGDVSSYSIDANNNVIETVTQGDIVKTDFFESNVISLIYQTENIFT